MRRFLKPEILEKTTDRAWQLVPPDFDSEVSLIHLANLDFITNWVSPQIKREEV